jgi:hypothetical protein
MLRKLQAIRDGWAALRRIQQEGERPRIIFYAENGDAWPHFEPILSALSARNRGPVRYITSSPGDPVLTGGSPLVQPSCIGDGALLIAFFESLRNAVLVMTTPDLQTFHLKRSRDPRVHYLYVHHSMVSTHMTYRPGAFDHFDTLFCVGPHHVAETRAREKRLALRPKELVEHGYGRLDRMIEHAALGAPLRAGAPAHILVAPSWGDEGLLESRGEGTIGALLDAGFRVTVRPHRRTGLRNRALLDRIRRRFAPNPRFTIDEAMASFASLASADLMVGDWSGAALEYAFAFQRPVLFVDVPRKVNDPDYAALGIEPLEVGIRHLLGEVVPPDDVAALVAAASRLLADPQGFSERIRAIRARTVYNLGRSGEVGAEAAIERLERLSRAPA